MSAPEMKTSSLVAGAVPGRLAATVSREPLRLSAVTAARALVQALRVRLLPMQAGAALRVLA
jgi:hypothetical protein